VGGPGAEIEVCASVILCGSVVLHSNPPCCLYYSPCIKLTLCISMCVYATRVDVLLDLTAALNGEPRLGRSDVLSLLRTDVVVSERTLDLRE
jgi:hypothetical protein